MIAIDEENGTVLVHHLNTHNVSRLRGRFAECHIDESDGLEFFSNNPERTSSRTLRVTGNKKIEEVLCTVKLWRGRLTESSRERIRNKLGDRV